MVLALLIGVTLHEAAQRRILRARRPKPGSPVAAKPPNDLATLACPPTRLC